MNRRKLLALTGLMLLPQTSRAQKTPALKVDLVLADAPIRTALELVMRGFGKNSYVIDNNVAGLLTARSAQLPFDELLKSLSKKAIRPFQWTQANGVVIIKPQPDSPVPSLDDLITRLQQAKLPVVEGIPCRMAGALFQGSTALAILEVGTPPDSDVQIVTEGRQIEVLGARYQVSKITPTELALVGAEKTLRVPLAPLLTPKC
ncbi:hypothetical protein [Armatimonas rosea]|uniref:Type II secretory pathway component GspD/PulD (Secretin) n=1 Tax=Armatimonas rosea TaxID=685828 RepID=A0A7W9SKG7_ARMRO|nr:hypothetical protein [Armatimonas rosea]MBB6048292.1 type II secretory pathway component GspD/PulD (secretin) [Armatimonas rosea]